MKICGSSDSWCTESAARDAFVRHVFPGQDPSQPVTTTPTEYVVFAPGGIRVGTITSWVSESGTTTYNVTGPDHWFRDGYVERTLIVREDGIYVRTFGEGTNTSVFMRNLNQGVAWPGFYRLNDDMRNYMRWQSLQ